MSLSTNFKCSLKVTTRSHGARLLCHSASIHSVLPELLELLVTDKDRSTAVQRMWPIRTHYMLIILDIPLSLLQVFPIVNVNQSVITYCCSVSYCYSSNLIGFVMLYNHSLFSYNHLAVVYEYNTVFSLTPCSIGIIFYISR